MSIGSGGDVVGRAIIEVAADTTAARAAFAQVKTEAASLATTMSASTTAAANTGAAAATSMATRIGSSLQKAGGFVSNFGKNLDRVGITMQSMGRTLTTYLTLPIVGLGVVSTKMALDWDRAWTRIAAVTNLNTKQIRGMKEEVMRLSKFTGTAPEELADGVYFLASAGLKGKQVMEALRVSARGAAVGLGDFGTTARLVANVLNAYEGSGMKAREVTDTLVAAIREGTAEPEEFASSMGRLLPIANAAGIGFDELAGSLATVSNIGLDVSEGTTAMRGILQALVAPGTAAGEAIHKIGLSLTEVRTMLSEEGLLPTLRELEQRTKAKFGEGWIDVMRDIIPNIRALTGELALTGQEASEVNDIFDAVTHSTGDMSEAFKVTAESDAFKFDRAMARLKAGLIELGQAIIPLLTKYVIPAIRDVIDWFEKLSDEQKEQLVKWGAIAAAAGPFLLAFGMVFRLIGSIVRVLGWATGGLGKFITLLGKVPAQTPWTVPGGGGGYAPVPGAPPGTGTGAPLPPAPPVPFAGSNLGLLSGGAALGLGGVRLLEPGEEVRAQAAAVGMAALQDHVELLASGQETLAEATDRAQGALEGMGVELDINAEAMQLAADSGVSYADALKVIEGNSKLISPELRENTTAMREWAAMTEGSIELTKEEQGKLADLVLTLDKNGVVLSENTLHQIHNLAVMGDYGAILDMLIPKLEHASRATDNVQSASDHAADAAGILGQKQLAAAGAHNAATGAANKNTTATNKAGGAAKKAGADVDGYKDKLAGIPTKKDTKISTPGMTAAQANAAHLKGLLDNISGNYNALINLTFQRYTKGQLAEGGMFHAADGAVMRAASGMVTQRPQVLVGEGRYKTPFGTGSEAVLPLNDAVLSRLGNAMANAMGRSGQGRGNGLQVTVNVNGVSGNMDEERLARMVSKHLARNMAAAGMWG